MGLGCFLPMSTTKFSLQNREKTMATEFDLFIDQNAHVHLHMGFCPILFICLFVFIYFSLVPILSICLLCSFFFSFAFLKLDVAFSSLSFFLSSFFFFFVFFVFFVFFFLFFVFLCVCV